MKLKLKKCMFCDRILPLGYYHKNKASKDGYWAWCKSCEKKYNYYDCVGNENHVVSFSGGKDSTAMLLMMIEQKYKIDAIIYFDCGTFEFPQMEKHVNLVEKNTGKKIIKIKSKTDFYELATKLQPRNEKINGWPTPNFRWCTMIKINKIKQRLRMYRPYIQYVGFSSDEVNRVTKAKEKGNNVKRDHFQKNKYPLIEFGMSETDCLKYCKDRGYSWDGLYDVFDRVSCWCCPLQKKGDLIKLYKYYPGLWKKLIRWNKNMPNQFRNDINIFTKIEKEALCQR